MMRVVKRVGVGTAVAVLLGTGVLASSAAAAPVGCGTVITADTTLTANVGPCPRGGLVIGADNVTLNLGGRTVFGKDRTGDGAGILIDGHTGVTVTNGRVRAFDAGVVIVRGGSNTVQGITAQDNIGSLKGKNELGDGITIRSSDGNTISANTAFHNGPFSGISIIGDTSDPAGGSSSNEIVGNRVVDNDVPSTEFGPNQDDGIRIEGPNAKDNSVHANTVRGNGLDGIAVFADQRTGLLNTGNQIYDNTVEGNGFHEFGHRKGDGIILFGLPTNPAVGGADSTNVHDNQVHGNAANGIRVNSEDNTITNNDARGNAAFPGVTAFDLRDINPTCDNNVWSGNLYTTATPICTTAP